MSKEKIVKTKITTKTTTETVLEFSKEKIEDLILKEAKQKYPVLETKPFELRLVCDSYEEFEYALLTFEETKVEEI